MKKLPLYLLFSVMPLFYVQVLPHVDAIEAALIINVLFAPALFGGRNPYLKVNATDLAVVAYVFIGLISVLVGSTSFYNSARLYRFLVVSPVVGYMVIRFSKLVPKDLLRGLYLTIPATAVQAIVIVAAYIREGQRPQDIGIADLITFSVWCGIGLTLLIYNRTNVRSRLAKLASLVAALILLAGLVASASRAAIVTFVLLVPFAGFIWKKRSRRRWFGYAAIATMAGLIVIIAVDPVFTGYSPITERQIEAQRSIKRITDWHLYVEDAQGRIAFWSRLMSEAMERPLLGHGTASYIIGKSGGTVFSLGSAHNALISALQTSGVPGMLVLLLLMSIGFRNMERIPTGDRHLEVVGKVMLIGYAIIVYVSLTNALSAGRGQVLLFMLAILSRLALPHRRRRSTIAQPGLRGVEANTVDRGRLAGRGY